MNDLLIVSDGVDAVIGELFTVIATVMDDDVTEAEGEEDVEGELRATKTNCHAPNRLNEADAPDGLHRSESARILARHVNISFVTAIAARRRTREKPNSPRADWSGYVTAGDRNGTVKSGETR